MGLRINNNIQAVNGHRNLLQNDYRVGRSMEKLSSGMKINRAADDSAGLIISEQMRAQITGLEVAVSNSDTAVNMIQTAEGALDEVSRLLNKARALALHAANEGVNDNAQLVADQAELDNITASVERIAINTQFGTKKILDGSLNNFRANDSRVGSTRSGNHYASGLADQTIVRGYHSLVVTTAATRGQLVVSLTGDSSLLDGTVSGAATSSEFQGSFTFAVNGIEIDVTSGQTVQDILNILNAVGAGAGFTALFQNVASGGGQYLLTNRTYGSSNTPEGQFVAGFTGATNLIFSGTAGSDVQGTLYLNTGSVGQVAGTGAGNTVQLTGGNGLVLKSSPTSGEGYSIELTEAITAGTQLIGAIDGMSAGAEFQVGANVGQTVSVRISSAKPQEIGRGVSTLYTSLSALGGSLLNGNAQEALKVIDKAIDDVTVQRGELGAFQANTLETGINSLRVSMENLTAAESTIRDVDFAKESANFTKFQILVQASTSMLAQANQLPQNVLQLLQG